MMTEGTVPSDSCNLTENAPVVDYEDFVFQR